MVLKSHISANLLLHIPSSVSIDARASHAEQCTSPLRRVVNHQAPDHRSNYKPPTIFLFVTGNPGLISFYHEFLSDISGRIDENGEKVVVVGWSLGGFELEDGSASTVSSSATSASASSRSGGQSLHESPSKWKAHSSSTESQNLSDSTSQTEDSPSATLRVEDLKRLLAPPGAPTGPIYSLHSQIDLLLYRLHALLELLGQDYPTLFPSNDGDERKVNLMLAGHSVGAWLALQIARSVLSSPDGEQDQGMDLSKVASSSVQSKTTSSTCTHSTISKSIMSALRSRIHISALHLLTPTISSISSSPSGRIFTPLITILAFLPILLQSLVRFLSWFLSLRIFSSRIFDRVVARATGMKSCAGREGDGLRTTAAFLKSRTGVKQALSMAGEEMRFIRELGNVPSHSESTSDLKGEGGLQGEVLAEESLGDVTLFDQLQRDRQKTDYGKVPGNSPAILRSQSQRAALKIFMLFAQRDHWVADSTRQHIIAEWGDIGRVEKDEATVGAMDEAEETILTLDRGVESRHAQNKSRVDKSEVTILIDERGTLNHAWCLEQSAMVADRVWEWMVDVLK